jgi:electron transfer flavoprotein alpha subunit
VATFTCWLPAAPARQPAEAAARIAGVSKVLVADAAALCRPVTGEPGGAGRRQCRRLCHLLAAATTSGKNFMPRVAALLDVAQISEIVAVESPDTFVRPIYAGNVVATVQSTDPIKVITVRATAFEAAGEGGSAASKVCLPAPTSPRAGWSVAS